MLVIATVPEEYFDDLVFLNMVFITATTIRHEDVVEIENCSDLRLGFGIEVFLIPAADVIPDSVGCARGK